MTSKPLRRAPPKWRLILCPIAEDQHAHDPHFDLYHSMSFLWLAERRQFSTILEVVRDKKYHHGPDAVTDWLHASSTTPLHDCLPFHPPTPLWIHLLAYASVHHLDTYGRNLLHMACYHNCHISIVVHLLRFLSPHTPDRHWQRLPLHWNCASTQRDGGDNNNAVKAVVVDANVVAIATTLTQRYSGAIHVRDRAGCVPNDLLVVSSQRRQRRSDKQHSIVAPDTMVVVPPAALRQTVSDLTNEGGYNNYCLDTSTTTTTTTTAVEEQHHADTGRVDTPTTSHRTLRHAWRRAATMSSS